MSDVQSPTLQAIAISLLVPSPTEAQAQRRKAFDKEGLQQLATSFKTAGVINPILVRPLGDKFEIVAGERRFQAAKLAALETVPCSVRELNDDQVLEVQLIENLQRQGLHELHEAEGYEQLRKRHHLTADEIAAKVGKSREYVFARLKLLALCPAARKSFYDGELNASTALHLARIPGEKMQKEALEEILGGRGDDPMSSRDALRHIQNNYMLRLSDAPFDTSDAKLLPSATACGACPKNTLAQPGLFGDVKSGSAGVCTDLPCFRAKAAAAIKARVAAAKAAGQQVVEGAGAKKIFPHGTYNAYGGYTKLDDEIYNDATHKYVKVKSLLPKDAKPVLVRIQDSDDREKLIEVVPDHLVKSSKRSAGVASNPQSAAEKKAKLETKIRKAVYEKVREKHPAKLGRRELELVAGVMLERLWDDNRKQVAALWMVDSDKENAWQRVDELKKKLSKLTDAEISKLLLDCVHIGELKCGGYNDSKPELLLAAAKKARINVDAIRKELTPAKKAKGSKAKKASKK